MPRIVVTLLLTAAALVQSPSTVQPSSQTSSQKASQASSQPTATQPADVIAHVERTIAWYRRINAIEQQPDISGDTTSRNLIHQSAVKAVELAFEFARAEALLLRTQTARTLDTRAPETSAASSFEQVGAQAAARVASLESQLKDIDTALQKASGSERVRLTNERDALSADLNITKTVQESIASILQFATTSTLTERPGDSLTAQINELARSVPEIGRIPSLAASPAPAGSSSGPSGSSGSSGSSTTSEAPRANNPAAGAATNGASAAQIFQPGSAGLMSLFTEIFTLRSDRSELDTAIRESDGLAQAIDQRRTPLMSEARDLVRRGEGAISNNADTAQMAAARRELQGAVGRVKQLSTALVPLGEQMISLETSRNVLSTWRNRLTQRIGLTSRYLLVRTVVLAAVIAVLLALSELWKRATFKYLRDVRRRSQLLMIRRVVVGLAVGLVVVMGFMSEVGSLATYAGFVTAGLAVALQNVILAIVAYFFFIGRYGVRVGDRVTISGVTGNVVEIGFVRIYLMELTGADWHPTGRIVVFSNAVLFQPSALFKQMPGVDYVWHTVTLTFQPTVDTAAAERSLREAVDSVYQQYREGLEQQHAALQRTLDVQTAAPQPDLHSRYTSDGIEFSIRYPVQRLQASEIDRQIIQTIRQMLAKDESLKLTPSGSPKVDVTG